MKVAYYPGCSLESSSKSYDISIKAVCRELGIELAPIEDWNCCGATEALTLSRLRGFSLVARNLALVSEEIEDLIAPCTACYLNLKKTDTVMREYPDWRDKINRALAAAGLHYSPGKLRVRNFLELLYHEVGRDKLQSLVKRPLKGLRVAPYYGCQFSRPFYEEADDPEHPKMLDRILEWLGATVIDFPLKTHCCGGHMTQISEELSSELLRRLLQNAEQYHADLIACFCPMCQLNLDAYQGQVNNYFNTNYSIPAVFFTQLMGVAFGFGPDELGFGTEIVSAWPVIDKKLRAFEEEEKRRAQEEGESKRRPRPRKRRETGLPMPKKE